jgi:SSS family solute:Na+ symporter
MPIIVVLPGLAAAMLVPDLSAPDKAYPEVLKLLPVGIKGLVFAALIAAIVSSLASMTNSIATIFTLDIFAPMKKGEVSERQLVTTGRVVSLSALVIATVVARPLLGNFDQAFQYIQEFTGFFTPGIVAIFMLAIFWKNTTANGALAAAVGSAVMSLGFKLYWPSLPFIDRVGLAFLLCMGLGMLISRLEGTGPHAGAIRYNEVDTSTSSGFNLAALVIVLMLTALYATWW